MRFTFISFFLLLFSFLLHANEKQNNRLLSAIHISDLDTALSALENGADVNLKIKTENGWVRPLAKAMQVGNDRIIYLLINYKNNSTNLLELDNVGKTSLHYAAIFGLTDLIEFLALERGISPDITDKHEQTPLQDLITTANLTTESRIKTASSLFNLGADVNPSTPFEFHSQLNDSRKVQKFRQLTLLHWAVLNTDISLEFLEFLIARLSRFDTDRYPVDLVNARDNYGQTPLHYTVYRNSSDAFQVAKLLIRSGSDPSIKATIHLTEHVGGYGTYVVRPGIHKLSPPQLASHYKKHKLSRFMKREYQITRLLYRFFNCW